MFLSDKTVLSIFLCSERSNLLRLSHSLTRWVNINRASCCFSRLTFQSSRGILMLYEVCVLAGWNVICNDSCIAEPLFVDPYAGCFVHPDVQMDLKCSHQYCLATKFIDDKLLRTVNHIDGLKQVLCLPNSGYIEHFAPFWSNLLFSICTLQVVLLTDGMDTRPYRLNWPTSTVIFDISSERIFKKSAEKLQGDWYITNSINLQPCQCLDTSLDHKVAARDD